MKKKINNELVEYQIHRTNSSLSIMIDDTEYKYELVYQDENSIVLKDSQNKLQKVFKSNHLLSINGESFEITSDKYILQGASEHHEGEMISPMPGKIVSVLVNKGQEVKRGDKLVIMEAMKMEHTILASEDGIVQEVFCRPGDQVDGGVELIGLKV